MKNWQKGLSWLAAAALVAVPGAASAQSMSDSTAQQGTDQQGIQQQGQQQGAQSQATTAQQPSAGSQQQQGASTQQTGTVQDWTVSRGGGPQGAQSNAPIPINGQFSFPLANNCTYQANVRGSARPTRGGAAAQGGEQLYVPTVNVDATVSCPNAPILRVSERIANQAPMTLRQVEQAVELRASLMSETSGAHCAYVPDFQLTQQQLVGVGAALLCPLPVQGAQGGGPQQGLQQQGSQQGNNLPR